jgi:hypothetical protein
MFENAQIGDRVWSLRYGWGIIKHIRPNTKRVLEVFFSINVNSTLADFTTDGKRSVWDLHPELFWNEFKIPPEAFIKPLPKLEKDTKVLVWYETGLFDKRAKQKRYFSHFSEEGKIHCYEQGRTSWSATGTQAWDNYEIYKEE